MDKKKEKEEKVNDLVGDESPKSLVKLIKRINVLLNEVSRLKSRNRDYEKIYNETVSFLKEISPRNPMHKRANELLSEFQARLDKSEKKKD